MQKCIINRHTTIKKMRKKHKVDIAVIDSGIMTDIEEFRDVKGIHFYYDDNERIVYNYDITDKLGHGTAVCSIIKNHCLDAHIYVVKIVDEDETDESLLLHALYYVYENIECKIVNLSLGIITPKHKARLKEICDMFFRNKIILISAFDNLGTIAYPAGFETVKGVLNSPYISKNSECIKVTGSFVNYLARGNAQRIKVGEKYIRMEAGNSFACAHVSGYYLKHIKSTDFRNGLCSLDDNLDISTMSVKQCIQRYPTKSTIPHNGNRIAVLPLNKEMNSLFMFEDLMRYEIVAVYDSVYGAKVGAFTDAVIKGSNVCRRLPIQALEKFDCKNIDGVIVGHCDRYMSIPSQRKLIMDIIKQCIQNKIWLFLFDPKDTYNLENIEETIIYSACAQKKSFIYNEFGMLFKNNIPVIGIFGTSSQQGKFTLQLMLRKWFLKNGYAVGQLGTEPQSELFGMDECFHFGYNAEFEIDCEWEIAYVNYLIHRICEKEPDLVIVGSQSGTIPWEFGNICGYTLKQQSFLMGTNPDIVTLCVNESDSIDDIERTIKYIESVVDCMVIALVVFPMTYSDEMAKIVSLDAEKFETFQKKCRKLNKMLMRLDDPSGINRLGNLIVNYFSTIV